MRGYDKKMESKWEKTEVGYLEEYFDKDVYSIYNDGPTAEDYMMFKKDKDFCTHSYPYPE